MVTPRLSLRPASLTPYSSIAVYITSFTLFYVFLSRGDLPRAHLHAVSAQRLGTIQSRIGISQQPLGNRLQIGFMPPRRDRCHADRHRQATLDLRSQGEWNRRDDFANAFGELRGLRRTGVRQKNGQFVAAESSRSVHAANLGFDSLRNLFECIVPRQMPVTVVDALEPVDVDHQAGDASGMSL